MKRTTTTAKAVSHLYSWKCSSPITCLSVYAINQCWCHVKLQKPKFKFAQFNYHYFKTKHDIVYIYRKIVPQVHVTGPAMHKYEMPFFLFRCKFIYINIFLQETFNVVWVYWRLLRVSLSQTTHALRLCLWTINNPRYIWFYLRASM